MPHELPNRHVDSVPGDFYVENDCCLACGVPEALAPNLIGHSGNDVGSWHCFWKKQPSSPEEIKQAIKVLNTQELGCHRYAGSDPAILDYADAWVCDVFNTPKRQFEVEKRESKFAITSLGGRTSIFERLLARIFRR